MSVNWWMDTQNMVYPHNLMPLGHKQAESTDTHKQANVQIPKVDLLLPGVGGGGMASDC